MVSFLVCVYFSVIIGWSFYYLFASFQPVLPWTRCDRWWNKLTKCVRFVWKVKMTIQILKKKFERLYPKKLYKFEKNKMYICRSYQNLQASFFCKILHNFKDTLKLLKITMIFTLFKQYLKKYIMFCKKKKRLLDINKTYICIFFYLTNIHYFFSCNPFNIFLRVWIVRIRIVVHLFFS